MYKDMLGHVKVSEDGVGFRDKAKTFKWTSNYPELTIQELLAFQIKNKGKKDVIKHTSSVILNSSYS